MTPRRPSDLLARAAEYERQLRGRPRRNGSRPVEEAVKGYLRELVSPATSARRRRSRRRLAQG